MKTRALALMTGVVLCADCSPGADVRGFPNAEANSICHFFYHCCTPVERTVFSSPLPVFGPFGTNSFSSLAQLLNFDNEGECDTKLGDALQTEYQPVQASVADGRMTWTTLGAQECIDALNLAVSRCDARAFVVALDGDGTPSSTPPTCTATRWISGRVAAGGACTLDGDCAGAASVCQPSVANQTVQEGGTCAALPTAGQTCTSQCQPGDSCCYGGVCMAYVGAGSACARDVGACFFSSCSLAPCDFDAQLYCGYSDAGYTCQPTLPAGAPCGMDPNGCAFDDSCQSGSCGADGTCAAANQGSGVTYNICTGNKDGI